MIGSDHVIRCARISHAGTLNAFKLPATAFVVLWSLVLLAPLMVFLLPLLRAKWAALPCFVIWLALMTLIIAGGLAVSAEDYLQFAQMLLNGGELAGKRLLGPRTIELMVSNNTGDMVNGHHICHGGYVFTLADSTFAFACNSYNHNTVAQGCAIEFLAPAREHDVLTATGRERSRAGRTGVYDVEVTNQRGETVALFRGKSYRIKGSVIEEGGHHAG